MAGEVRKQTWDDLEDTRPLPIVPEASLEDTQPLPRVSYSPRKKRVRLRWVGLAVTALVLGFAARLAWSAFFGLQAKHWPLLLAVVLAVVLAAFILAPATPSWEASQVRKRLFGLLLVAIMILTPYVGEYIKNRIDAIYSARAYARASNAGFANAFCPTPAGNSGEGERSHDGTLEIIGSPEFRRKIRQALDLLRRKDPDGYRLVVENLGVVRECWEEPSIYAGGAFWVAPDNIRAGTKWLASVLVHEAFHAANGPAEAPAYRRQKETLAKLRAPKHTIDWIGKAFEQRYGKPLPPD